MGAQGCIAIVGAQRGQPLWAHNMDKDAIVGAQRGKDAILGAQLINFQQKVLGQEILPKTCPNLPKILSKIPRLAARILPKILAKILGKILAILPNNLVQELFAGNVDKGAIVGAQRGEGCLWCHILHHINGHM